MFRRICNISRSAFIRLQEDEQFASSKESNYFISIHGTDPSGDNTSPLILSNIWKDGIVVCFDDTEHNSAIQDNILKIITIVESMQIVNFLKRINDDPRQLNLIIHCFAGISRSAAVGKFCNDVFKLNLHNYNRLSLYNRYVYSMLLDAWLNCL